MSKQSTRKQLAELGKITAGQLRDRYEELFGDRARSGNRQWLFRRCAWRIQALAEGGLSERARQPQVRRTSPRSLQPRRPEGR